MVDTEGRVLIIGFSEANLHDSKGGAALLKASRRHWPFVELVWADAAYKGRPTVEQAAAPARVEIVSGIAGQKRFVVQPRRWVVERSFALILSLSKGVQPLSTPLARLRNRPGDHLRHDLRRKRLSAYAAHRQTAQTLVFPGIKRALSLQGKRISIECARSDGKADLSAPLCGRRGSTGARSPNGSGLMRFPRATPPRRRRLRHDISRNIWLAGGRKVAFVAAVFFKRSKRAAIQAVSQTSRDCWRNGVFRNTRRRGLRHPLQGRPSSIRRQAGRSRRSSPRRSA